MKNEQVDSSRRRRPFVRDVLPLVHAYLAARDWTSSGPLHLVLENGNLKDWHILSCRDACTELGDEAGRQIADAMLGLSPSNRTRIYRQGFRGQHMIAAVSARRLRRRSPEGTDADVKCRSKDRPCRCLRPFA